MKLRVMLALMTVGLLVPARPNAQAPAPPAGGLQQGIKVHGRWTIDVRNADGTLASHHEFNNALTGDGAIAVSSLLGKAYTRGEWRIVLVGTTPETSACLRSAGGVLQPASCVIVEATDAIPTEPSRVARSLTATSVPGIHLTGSLRAIRAGVIGAVETESTICDQTVAPVNCKGAAALPNTRVGLTRAVLATPIPVVEGQFIDVTVVLSFS